MTHLTMEQILNLQEPGSEPGSHGVRTHLDSCSRCQAEVDRLHQRVARIRALPGLRPPRKHFGEIQRRLTAESRRRALRRVGWGGLALAASVAFLAVILPLRGPVASGAPGRGSLAELETTKLRSQQLEAALNAMDLDRRLLDGRTANLASRIEDQLGLLDRQLQLVGGIAPVQRRQQEIQLWRERVGLLDALVDVHMTRARHAGL